MPESKDKDRNLWLIRETRLIELLEKNDTRAWIVSRLIPNFIEVCRRDIVEERGPKESERLEGGIDGLEQMDFSFCEKIERSLERKSIYEGIGFRG